MITSNKGIRFTVSARAKPNSCSMEKWLSRFDNVVDDGKIDSVYGFSTFSPLYGGRSFKTVEITDDDIDYMYLNGIGFRIPLTNLFFSEKDYKETIPLLEKYHKTINSIICVNDELALRIKEDYPKYTIEASVIKNTKFLDVNKRLEIYDSVVLPMEVTEDYESLNNVKNKDRVILFANAKCAYNCPSKICYSVISKIHNNSIEVENPVSCSVQLKPREDLGTVFFDLEKLKSIGFTRFKLLVIDV
jgi:hypothetical protein